LKTAFQEQRGREWYKRPDERKPIRLQMKDISLHILDVAENGITAGARRIEIEIDEDINADRLVVTIRDDGRGMSAEFLARVLDPFTTTRNTRKVGLGLPLFQHSARQAGGDLRVESELGVGTKVIAYMSYSHIDRKPMGDLIETMSALICGNPEVDFKYTYVKSGRTYTLDTGELRPEQGNVAMNHPEVV
jgi:K+-sensing histidine kinase KdpD